MCGNCGWFTQQGTVVSANQRRSITKVTEALLSANTSRGTDATGVAVINEWGKSSVYKRAVNAFEFISLPKAQRQIRKPDAMIVIGHTRLGTMGPNIDKNAHPFVEGQVVGAHNGIIWNHWDIDDAVKGLFPQPSRVDSQAAFRILSAMTDPVAALSQVEGQAALIWHDARRPMDLNMVRHENPLALVWVDRIKTLFWSSESIHLWTAITAAFGRDGWWPISMEEDVLYTFNAVDVLDYTTRPVPFKDDWQATKKRWAAEKGWGTNTRVAGSKVKGGKGGTDEGGYAVADDWCPMCGDSVNFDDMVLVTGLSPDDDEFVCQPCGKWYEDEGRDAFPDVIEAIGVSDRMVRTGGKSLREESEIARIPVISAL